MSAMSSLSLSQTNDNAPVRTFVEVGGEKNLDKMGVITEIFHRILAPLYGSQEKALRQIEEGKDRKCYLLYEGPTPSGVLVFKSALSNEFEPYGVTDSIEIKSLFLDHSVQNSGRGLGSILIDKAHQEAKNLNLGHQGLHVTVSETKGESLAFFRKKGFSIVHQWMGRYQEGTTEYLLACPSKIQALFPSSAAVTSARQGAVQLLQVFSNAHFGLIHALKKLSDGTIISGSGDNCLYKWDLKQGSFTAVKEVEPSDANDRNWITAVEVYNDDYWISGERNGKVFLWRTDGTLVREIKPKLPKYGDHVCHEYNMRRVNCLAPSLDPSNPGFFIGFPSMFDEYSWIENRTVSTTTAHANDWVYCLHPLDQQRIITGTGGTLNLWKKEDQQWNFGETLLAEGKRVPSSPLQVSGPKWQRPFISSLAPLPSAPSHFALSLFDSSVKIFDMERKKVVQSWKEHQGRVWKAEPLSPHLLASGAEDKAIKLWDTRTRKSVQTLDDHIGQVTALLSYDENTLVAGTCSANALIEEKGGEIRVYDIRV